jgi:hypothetical protein
LLDIESGVLSSESEPEDESSEELDPFPDPPDDSPAPRGGRRKDDDDDDMGGTGAGALAGALGGKFAGLSTEGLEQLRVLQRAYTEQCLAQTPPVTGKLQELIVTKHCWEFYREYNFAFDDTLSNSGNRIRRSC